MNENLEKKIKNLKTIIVILIIIIIALFFSLYSKFDNVNLATKEESSEESNVETENEENNESQNVEITFGKLYGVTYKEAGEDEAKVYEVDTVTVNHDSDYAAYLNYYYSQLSQEAIDNTVLIDGKYLDLWPGVYTGENLRKQSSFELSYSTKGNIGTIVAYNKQTHVESGGTARYIFDNINIETGDKATNYDVLQEFNLTEAEAFEKVNTSCFNYFSVFTEHYTCIYETYDYLNYLIIDGELYYYIENVYTSYGFLLNKLI
ncbi:MAG: hypothetical protein R3Y13_01020 [bacterium]